MRYFKEIEKGILKSIGTGLGGIEITESEYNALMDEIHEKTFLVDCLYCGEITISNVPDKWKDEIQRMVDDRRAYEAEHLNDDVSVDEIMEALGAVL